MSRCRWVRRAGTLAAGITLVTVLAGCAGASQAESATSLVRARPTTSPNTYALQMAGAMYALRESLDQLSALLAEPRYLDDAWRSQAINLATLTELGYRQIEGLSPPADEQAQHAETVRAAEACQSLTAYVLQGINNLDKGPFDEVKERVDFCRSKLDAAARAPGSAESQRQPVSLEAARQSVHVRVKRDANLRSGPGTSYPRVATAAPGDTFTAIGRTGGGDWLEISNDKIKNAWIAVFLLEVDGDLTAIPVQQDQPSP